MAELGLVPDGEVRLLSVREVARVLRVAPFTVYGLCGRGQLAHVRMSNAIRIRPGDLETFVRGQD
jgi:excisionase family DNA binding protein